MNIRKALIVLAMLVVGAAVFAAAIPNGSTLTLYDSTGNVVGVGSNVNGNLSLTVLSSYTGGSATLAVTNHGGHTMTYSVTVTMLGYSNNPTGALVFPLYQLNASFSARREVVSITVADTLPTPGTVFHGPNDHANLHATIKMVHEPNDHANANATVKKDHSNSPHLGRGYPQPGGPTKK